MYYWPWNSLLLSPTFSSTVAVFAIISPLSLFLLFSYFTYWLASSVQVCLFILSLLYKVHFFSLLLYLCSVLSFCPKEKVLTPSVSVLWILNTDTSPSGHEFLVSAHLKSKHNLNSWVNRAVPVWKGRSWIELTYLCKFTSRNFLDATQLGV